jgi:single-strand DNA-binding protein
MNHITLCGKVTTNELRYTQNNDPLCVFTVRYPWSQGQVATLETQVYGDKAIDLHQSIVEDEVVAVTGSIERFKIGNDYCVHVRGQGIESLDRYVPLNKIVLAGRVGADPDVKRFQNGSVKAVFNIAINRGRDIAPTWHRIELWGNRAEVAEQYVRKGSLVGVEGELLWMPLRDRETGAYLKGKQGMPYIKAERLELLGGKSQEERDW